MRLTHPPFQLAFAAALLALATLGAGLAMRMALIPPINPLLRVLAPDDLAISRQMLSNPNTAAGLAQFERLLTAAHRPIPAYLRLVCDEYNGPHPQTARFSVGCYWEGEAKLGALPGVVSTRTGLVGKDEVVELHFNPRLTTAKTLTADAKQFPCFRGIVSPQPALVEADQQQHTLANHPQFAHIPLTPLQRTRLNAALWNHQDPTPLLSPRQLRMMREQE